MSQLTRFCGKTVLVTGGASGIGQAVVVRLASEGASVVAFDVNEAGLRETVAKAAAAAASGGRARYLTGSVANEAAVKRAISDVIEQAGQLHSLINMAGVLRASPSTDVSLEQFRAVIDVNLVGTFLFCREALPHLLATRGCIVNAASTAALFGHPYMAAYAASKGGVYALTRALAWEYLKQGVRVNAVAPGGIATPMSASVHDATMSLDTSLFQHLVRPGGGFGRPEQVATVVAMLASEDAGYMTGEVVKVDGGVHS